MERILNALVGDGDLVRHILEQVKHRLHKLPPPVTSSNDADEGRIKAKWVKNVVDMVVEDAFARLDVAQLVHEHVEELRKRKKRSLKEGRDKNADKSLGSSSRGVIGSNNVSNYNNVTKKDALKQGRRSPSVSSSVNSMNSITSPSSAAMRESVNTFIPPPQFSSSEPVQLPKKRGGKTKRSKAAVSTRSGGGAGLLGEDSKKKNKPAPQSAATKAAAMNAIITSPHHISLTHSPSKGVKVGMEVAISHSPNLEEIITLAKYALSNDELKVIPSSTLSPSALSQRSPVYPSPLLNKETKLTSASKKDKASNSGGSKVKSPPPSSSPSPSSSSPFYKNNDDFGGGFSPGPQSPFSGSFDSRGSLGSQREGGREGRRGGFGGSRSSSEGSPTLTMRSLPTSLYREVKDIELDDGGVKLDFTKRVSDSYSNIYILIIFIYTFIYIFIN